MVENFSIHLAAFLLLEKLSFHIRNSVLISRKVKFFIEQRSYLWKNYFFSSSVSIDRKVNFPLIVFFLVGEKVNVCIAAFLLVENFQ
jgi:hypothetical protein